MALEFKVEKNQDGSVVLTVKDPSVTVKLDGNNRILNQNALGQNMKFSSTVEANAFLAAQKSAREQQKIAINLKIDAEIASIEEALNSL